MAGRKRRGVRALAWGAAGLLIVISVIGFAPTVLAPLVSARLSSQSGLAVRVGWISWNPLVASVALRDVTIAPDASEPPIVTIGAIRVNVALRRWVGGERLFDSVVVERPWVALQRTASGDFNLAALFRAHAEPATSAEPPPADDRSLRVATFRIVGGSVRFRDETTTPVLETSLYLDDVEAHDVALSGGGAAEIRLRAASRLDEAPMTLDLTYRASADHSDLAAHFAVTGASLSRTLLYVPLGWQKVAGTIDVELTYQRRIVGGALRAHSLGAQAHLRDVAIGEPWAVEPSLRAKRVRLGEIAVDLIRRRTDVGIVDVQDFSALIARTEDGLHLPLASSGGGGPDTQWRTTLRTVTLGSGEVLLRNVIPDADPEIRMPVERGTITFPHDHVAFAITGTLAGGKLDVKGRVAKSSRITFTPRDVALPEVVSLLRLPVAFSAGRVDGQLVAHVADGPVRYTGTLAIRGAKSVPDAARPEDVFAWDELTLTLAETTFVPLDLHVSRLALAWPYLMVHREATGVYPLTLSRPGTDAPAPSPDGEQPTAHARPWLRVDTGTIHGGRIELYDTTLSPAFGMDLADLAGSFDDLSAAPWSAARLQLAGAGDELSPFHLDGTARGHDAALGFTIERLRLPPLSRYLEPSLGYEIASGIARIESTVDVEHAALDARNELALSRLALRRSGSDVVGDAIGMPLPVALALMKDLRGNIHLTVPVHGNVASSEYRLGSLVGNAIREGLIGAVSTPLRLLGSIFRRDDTESYDLEPVPFPPGSAALGPDGDARVAQVARLLGRHTELRASLIPVPASADVVSFRDEAMITQLEHAERTLTGDALLAFLRARRAGASPAPLAPEVAAALRELEEATPVPLERIAALAAERTALVARALTKTHGIEIPRVREEQWEPTDALPDSTPGVDLQLRGG